MNKPKMPCPGAMPHGLSVLFVSYNRSDLLATTVRSLRDGIRLGPMPVEFVVTDDGSAAAHRREIMALPFDKFSFSDRNEGLGANVNKGLRCASYEYVLQVQDDCEFIGPPDVIRRALEILEADPSVGIVQLVSTRAATVRERRALPTGAVYLVFENDMMPGLRDCGLRPYSDQPHIKRLSFCTDIGPYMEGAPMTLMELDYQRRVANQASWYVAALEDGTPFRHLGADRSFNPSHLRARRIAATERWPLVGRVLKAARALARKLRSGA
ncbi:MAG: glycosyltransferase family 2 protein [Thermoanaerobaculia bacterium]